MNPFPDKYCRIPWHFYVYVPPWNTDSENMILLIGTPLSTLIQWALSLNCGKKLTHLFYANVTRHHVFVVSRILADRKSVILWDWFWTDFLRTQGFLILRALELAYSYPAITYVFMFCWYWCCCCFVWLVSFYNAFMVIKMYFISFFIKKSWLF